MLRSFMRKNMHKVSIFYILVCTFKCVLNYKLRIIESTLGLQTAIVDFEFVNS